MPKKKEDSMYEHYFSLLEKYKKNSGYRKPGNLMIKDLLKNWPINVKKSFMIGDQKTDQICAENSNIFFEYVDKNMLTQMKRLTKSF